MLENLDKIMHLCFNFDACPMHSPFGLVHLTHQNLSARALFCLNSLVKVSTQLLIYNYGTSCFHPGLDEILQSKTVWGLFFEDKHCIVAKKKKKKNTESLMCSFISLFCAQYTLKIRLITARTSQFIDELDFEVRMSRTSWSCFWNIIIWKKMKIWK